MFHSSRTICLNPNRDDFLSFPIISGGNSLWPFLHRWLLRDCHGKDEIKKVKMKLLFPFRCSFSNLFVVHFLLFRLIVFFFSSAKKRRKTILKRKMSIFLKMSWRIFILVNLNINGNVNVTDYYRCDCRWSMTILNDLKIDNKWKSQMHCDASRNKLNESPTLENLKSQNNRSENRGDRNLIAFIAYALMHAHQPRCDSKCHTLKRNNTVVSGLIILRSSFIFLIRRKNKFGFSYAQPEVN